MKEHPILFNGAMVSAILEGRKTVTRRAVKATKAHADGFMMLDHGKGWWPYNAFGDFTSDHEGMEYPIACPYGQPGDRLWVREAWQLHEKFTDNCVAVYKANERNSWTEFHRRFPVEVARGCQAKPFQTHGFRPSIHMPRWASRILLEITNVRIERLQDISTEQIIAEGLSTTLREHDAEVDLRRQWRELWESTGGDWGGNPWVWCVSFRRIEQ